MRRLTTSVAPFRTTKIHMSMLCLYASVLHRCFGITCLSVAGKAARTGATALSRVKVFHEKGSKINLKMGIHVALMFRVQVSKRSEEKSAYGMASHGRCARGGSL